MSEIINLQKQSFNKTLYPKIVDIEFSQLLTPQSSSQEDLTVDEFFQLYDKLFFEIPINGEIGSHKELIKRSTEYVGETQNTDTEDLLLEEINQLRLELLEAQQIIEDLTK